MNQETSNSSVNKVSVNILVAVIGAIGLVLAATVPPLLNNNKETAVAARETTVAETQIALAPQLTQVAQILNATPTTAPRFVERITVPSTTNLGVVYSTSHGGTYTFEYVTGVSALGRLQGASQESLWTTKLFAFSGNEPIFDRGEMRIDQSLFSIGDGNYSSEYDATIETIGSRVSVELQANQQVTLVVADGQFNFDDNSGEIVLDIYFVPST